MSRKALFDFARPLAPQGQLTPAMVAAGDAFADALGLPRADDGQRGDLRASPSASGDQRMVSKAGIDLIHSFESFQQLAYRDPGSKDGLPITIGWGSTRDEQGKPIRLGDVWTRERADARFADDLADFTADVLKAVAPAPVTQGQLDALVSFAYNVGIDAFRSSTLLKMHKAGDYAGAKAQFARWCKNDGQTLKGLVRRRAAEAALYGAG